jgi:hypothetical protein
MDTDRLKALQTLGDASHFLLFNCARKEFLYAVKLTASSADPWCASALFQVGSQRLGAHSAHRCARVSFSEGPVSATSAKEEDSNSPSVLAGLVHFLARREV